MSKPIESADTLWAVDQVCNEITKLYTNNGVPLPLLVVYVWDIIRDFYNDSDMSMKPKIDVWQRLWAEAETQGFTLEYGSEALYDHLRDWLIETGLMVDITDVEEAQA